MSGDNWETLKAVAIVALPGLGAVVTGIVTRDNSWPYSEWYKQLKKPWFSPPNWLFPPVWTALYCSMGYASYLVYRAGVTSGADVALPLAVYGSHLFLNLTWPPLYFNCKNYGLATASILAILGGAAASAGLFYRVNHTAAYLLLPYVGWLSLASAVMYSIWKNNPPAEFKYRRTFFGRPIGPSEDLKEN